MFFVLYEAVIDWLAGCSSFTMTKAGLMHVAHLFG